MPLPKPRADEDRTAFMKRCMGNPTAVQDFPNTRHRAAVCASQWRRRNKDEENMERKYLGDVQFETKDLHEGEFEGHGSLFDQADDMNDIVARGAFKKTLRDLKKRGLMPALLWHHNPEWPLGVYHEVREDSAGLYVRGQLNLQVQHAKDAHEFLKQGAISGLSIGYRTIKSKMNHETQERILTEVALFEISLVMFPMLDTARVTAVKHVDDFADLEIVDRHWDPESAARRVKDWAGDDEAKLALAFVGATQIADIVENKLVVVVQALKGAASLLSMADPENGDRDHARLYFQKINADPPWIKGANGDLTGAIHDVTAALAVNIVTERDFERFLRDSGFARKRAVALAAAFKAVSPEGDPQGGLSKEWFAKQMARRTKITTTLKD